MISEVQFVNEFAQNFDRDKSGFEHTLIFMLKERKAMRFIFDQKLLKDTTTFCL